MAEHKIENKAEKHEKSSERQQVSENASANLRHEAYQSSTSQRMDADKNTAAAHLPGLELTDSQKPVSSATTKAAATEEHSVKNEAASKENPAGGADSNKSFVQKENNERAANQSGIDQTAAMAARNDGKEIRSWGDNKLGENSPNYQRQMKPQPGDSAHNFVQNQLSDVQQGGAAPDLAQTAHNAAQIAQVVGSGIVEAGVHKAQEMKNAVENGAKGAADWVHTHQGQTLGLIAVGAAAAIVEVGTGGLATPAVAGFVGGAMAAMAPAVPALEAAGVGFAAYKSAKAISEAGGHNDFGNLLRDNGTMSPKEREKSQAHLKSQTGENILDAAQMLGGAAAARLASSRLASPVLEAANSAKDYIASAAGLNAEAGAAGAAIKAMDKSNSVADNIIETFTPVHKKPNDDQ